MSLNASWRIKTGRKPVCAGPDEGFSPDLTDFLAEMLATGRTLRFRVSGQSMHPTIQSGDYVFLSKPDIGKLRTGDLILCGQESGRMALHRLIAVFRDHNGRILRLTTKGDSVDIPDPPMEAGAVLGRVIEIERQRTSRIVRRRLNTPLFIGINLLLGIYYRIRSDAICAWVRFKADRWRRQGNDHAV